MLTDVRPVSNGRKWHIDHINNAPTGREALRRMEEWIHAELRDCQVRRPQDADGFRVNPPKLPGGGWVAKHGANVRHP